MNQTWPSLAETMIMAETVGGRISRDGFQK